MAVQAQRFLSSRTRWIVFGVLVAVSVYLLAVTPVRTYIDQRGQMSQAEQRYELLADANKRMNDRVAQLQTDAEIERLARERELVPPGRQAYAVMPPPSADAPAVKDSDKNHGLWSTVWDKVTFWN